MKFSKSTKNLIILFIFVLISTNIFAQTTFNSSESELSIYNEVNSTFYTGFYPGTVEKANLLKRKYPESVFIIPAMVLKGEAQVYLGRFNEAAQTLYEIIPSIHLGDENYEKAFFYLGKAYFYSGEYEKSISAFYQCSKSSVSQYHYDYYFESLLFSARGLFVTENYEKVVPVIEYLLQHLSEFEKSERDELIQKIMISYNQTGLYEKNVQLFKTLRKEEFSDEIYYRLAFQAASSYDALNQNQQAYELYCEIISTGNKGLAVISLQKAYLITTKENAVVRSEELFETTQKTIEEFPSIVCEFWVRLAIDCYSEKKYDQALVYLQSAEQEIKDDSEGLEYVIALYKEKIRFETEEINGEQAEVIENSLRKAEDKILACEFNNISDVYYSILLRCKMIEKEWDQIENLYSKIKKADEENLYYLACSEYQKQNYSKVEELVMNQSSPKFLNLLAKSAVNQKQYTKAKINYEKLLQQVEQSNLLLPEGTSVEELELEYAKVLYKMKDYSGCYKISSDIVKTFNSKDAKYLAGLSAANLKKWNETASYFSDYEKVIDSEKKSGIFSESDKNFYAISLYFSGYANFNLGNYEKSYDYFVKYNEVTFGKEKYASASYELAAKSALQLRQFDKAAFQGEKLIKSIENPAEKQSAIIFCAELYVDGGNYKSAINILKPWTEENNDFAVKCLYKTAQIYQKSGDFDKAEDYYEKVVAANGKSSLAEDSLFYCGEMFYSVENYVKAEDKFGRYIYKYVEGRYAERALFFSGECNFKLKKYERAVMLYTRLTEKYKNSTYLYGSYKNLLEANYEMGSYPDALKVAKFIKSNFTEQAENEGITAKITELEKIISGMDTTTALQFSEFEKRGGIKTVAGRKAGTRLVQMYLETADTQKDGIVLALQLLPLEQGNLTEEAADAAVNANQIADWYRANGSTKEAADYYLLAAEYYRASNEKNILKPASALYGAAEAFVAEGMNGDARETAALLVELYPDTKYADAVSRLRIK